MSNAIRTQDVIAGFKCGHLTVIQKVRDATSGAINTRKRVRVECVCGKRETIPTYYLTRKEPKTHCGCKTATYESTHKPEFNSWWAMKWRCLDTKHPSYKEYGGRGIKICDRWLHPTDGFRNFVQDMGPRPSKQHTLDRINPDGNYEPNNTRWATWDVQNRNKRKFQKKETSNAPR
jgi:hypothetical protein